MTQPIYLLSGLALGAIIIFGIFYWREHRYDKPATVPAPETGTALAYFAGGCFWCTEADFEKVSGIKEVVSGYSGGKTDKPTYESVSAHTTGHVEAVEVRYDPAKVTYAELVEYFFAHVDPTDPGGQFADRGDSYVSVVFYQSEEEKKIVEAEIARLIQSGAYDKPIVTQVRKFERFYLAEDYHQDYSKKNSLRYNFYRSGSGRDAYLEKTCAIRAQKNIVCNIKK